jgi:hypothetical protein
MVEDLQLLLAATALCSSSVLTLELRMGYDYDYFSNFGPRYSNFDPGSYPRQGYVHRHGGIGDRQPKKFRRKERNRPGLSR